MTAYLDFEFGNKCYNVIVTPSHVYCRGRTKLSFRRDRGEGGYASDGNAVDNERELHDKDMILLIAFEEGGSKSSGKKVPSSS